MSKIHGRACRVYGFCNVTQATVMYNETGYYEVLGHITNAKDIVKIILFKHTDAVLFS